MNAAELHGLVGLIISRSPDAPEMRPRIVVHRPGALGPTPTVELERVDAGFDWDRRSLLLTPARPLTELSAEDIQAIHASVKSGESWHAYQAYKAQQAQINELRQRLAERELEIDRLRKLTSSLRDE